ncbi:DUF6719 family protein [Tianweitania sediminis]
MSRIVLAVSAAISLAGCNSTMMTKEPAAGTLATGVKVLVDDGSCPQGQVKQVTGSTPGVPRKKECVARPS